MEGEGKGGRGEAEVDSRIGVWCGCGRLWGC